MKHISVSERLEMYATDGYDSSSLRLYKRQMTQLLIRDGIAVQCVAPVPGWKG